MILKCRCICAWADKKFGKDMRDHAPLKRHPPAAVCRICGDKKDTDTGKRYGRVKKKLSQRAYELGMTEDEFVRRTKSGVIK